MVLSAGDARRPVKVSLADMGCVGLGGRESIAGAEAIVIQVIALRSGAIIQHVPKVRQALSSASDLMPGRTFTQAKCSSPHVERRGLGQR
jgi:hypothetical protein